MLRDVRTDTLTGGEEVLDGVDRGGGGRLRSPQRSVRQQGLEHAQLLQGLMGRGREKVGMSHTHTH